MCVSQSLDPRSALLPLGLRFRVQREGQRLKVKGVGFWVWG